jgi:hypothetical protein
MPSLAARPGLARDEEGGAMNEAYKQSGHKYRGRNVGRGGRQQSKITKALKNIASFDLIDEVLREDRRRREARERQGVAA